MVEFAVAYASQTEADWAALGKSRHAARAKSTSPAR